MREGGDGVRGWMDWRSGGKIQGSNNDIRNKDNEQLLFVCREGFAMHETLYGASLINSY